MWLRAISGLIMMFAVFWLTEDGGILSLIFGTLFLLLGSCLLLSAIIEWVIKDEEIT